MRQRRHTLAAGVLFCIFLLLIPASARAHPLGNDSITHFSVLYVLPDQFRVDYLLDIAETPAGLIRRDEIDADHDDDDTVEEQNAWLDRKAADFAGLLRARLDGEPLVLAPLKEVFDPRTGQKAAASRMILKMPGFGGMPTYRVLIGYGGPYPHPLAAGRQHVLHYVDETFSTVPGLRRMLLEETGITTARSLKLEDLRPGPAPRALLDLAARANMQFTPDAVLKPAGEGRFILIEGKGCLAVAAGDEGPGLFRSPYISIDPPRPSYWNEGLDPFLYEQYDPGDLPQEKSATIRFTLEAPCPGTSPAAALPPASAQTTTEPATQPAPAGSTLPPFVDRLMDPRNNPAKTSQYYRQADTLIGMLKEPAGGRGVVLFVTITFLAFTWGAGHALMPGHAKTVVAAYLISQRGTYWHAILLAIIVTITHTALVVIVGLIVYFYQQSHPTLGPQIQLWLGMLAGVLVAAMGGTLVYRAITGRIVHHHHDHDHDHDHDHQPHPWWRKLFTHSHPHLPGHDHGHHHHGHDHHHDHGHSHHHDHGHGHPHTHDHVHDHGHVHDPAHSHSHAHHHGHPHDHAHVPASAGYASVRPAAAQAISTRMLLVLGITGGIVPCPTAMIILLLGIGANVVAWALYAVGVFSLGLALTLMLIGFAALASRRFATRLLSDAEHEGELSGTGRRVMFQLIPAVSGLVVVALGGMIAANYFYIMRAGRPLFAWLG